MHMQKVLVVLLVQIMRKHYAVTVYMVMYMHKTHQQTPQNFRSPFHPYHYQICMFKYANIHEATFIETKLLRIY